MEFRLIYQGPLPSEKCEDGKSANPSRRAKEKHTLRKHFHPQLRELWRQDPALREQANSWFIIYRTPSNKVDYPGPGVRQIERAMPNAPGAKKYIDHIADAHVRFEGNRFVPLVSEAGGFTCALDILFLRRDNPGSVIENGGDIDNRVKVLLDGLRMPKNVGERGGLPIAADEHPFYCLLEDDKLITRVTVTTDRLILPKKPSEPLHDVFLMIHVTVVNPEQLFAGGRLV